MFRGGTLGRLLDSRSTIADLISGGGAYWKMGSGCMPRTTYLPPRFLPSCPAFCVPWHEQLSSTLCFLPWNTWWWTATSKILRQNKTFFLKFLIFILWLESTQLNIYHYYKCPIVFLSIYRVPKYSFWFIHETTINMEKNKVTSAVKNTCFIHAWNIEKIIYRKRGLYFSSLWHQT